MRVRLFEGMAGDSATVSTHQVQGGQSIVFLTPSVLNPVLCARFYDSDGVVHQVPAAQIISIDPDSDLRLPVRYLDPETSKEVAALRADVDRMKADTGRLGPRQETPEETEARTARMVEAITEAVDRSKLCTTNGKPVAEVRASQTNETGQHDGYIVLCPDERAKGFIRPYRDKYEHVGRLQQLVDDAGADSHQVRTGGCGTVTTMGKALSETYQRDPSFYGATFCCGCNRHLPVSEFVWTADGQEVGS